jgi:hypothetical protein
MRSELIESREPRRYVMGKKRGTRPCAAGLFMLLIAIADGVVRD